MIEISLKRAMVSQLLAICHFLLIYFAYLNYVQPVFYYAGLVGVESTGRFLVGFAGTVAVTALVGLRSATFSDSVLSTLLVFLVIPSMAFWAATTYSVSMLVLITGSICLVALFCRVLPLVRFPFLHGGRFAMILISIFLIASFALLVVSRGGLAFLNFSFTEVYEYRSVIHDTVLHGIAGYLWSNLGKCVLPLLFGLMLFQRRFIFAFAVLAAQAMVFALTSHKELIFYPAVVFFMYFYRNSLDTAYLYQRFQWHILGLLITVLLIAFIGITYPANLLVMRAFISTPFNHFEYFAFFQDAEFLRWSNSLLSGVYEYSYSVPIGEVIGYGRYGEGEASNANAGYIAMGYAHAGVAGVILYSLLLAIILWIADSLSSGFGDAEWLVPAMGFVVGMQLVAADLPTTLLSHGFGLMILMFWLVNRSKLGRSKNRMAVET